LTADPCNRARTWASSAILALLAVPAMPLAAAPGLLIENVTLLSPERDH